MTSSVPRSEVPQYVQTSSVASFGVPGRTPSRDQWEQLADLGVAKATLAFEDDADGWQRVFETICANKLVVFKLFNIVKNFVLSKLWFF